jgi:threonine dehydratase
MNQIPTFRDVCDAKTRLMGMSVNTPILTNQKINQLVGAEVYFKCENLQHVGAFKFRGAYNAVSQLSDAQKAAGVIAYSSGNHAQAIARVCEILGIDATIIMPSNAPQIKRQATESYGARVIEYDPDVDTRELIAEQVNGDNQLTLLPPFNHPHIIAGQGTAALELIQEKPEIAQVLVPCGGGGLLSGTALAIKGTNLNCQVIGVEPELADDATRSFKEGKIVTIDYPNTIADGTRTLSVGDITLAVMLEYVDAMETVSEELIKEAVRVLFYHLKQVIEPSGALGLAALLSGKIKLAPQIGIILSGGNIDGNTMSSILNEDTKT